MRHSGDLPNGRLTVNGVLPQSLPQSILKDTSSPTSKTHNEARKVRHLSNESSSSSRGVTFDKSLPCDALRGEQERDQLVGRSIRNRRTSLPATSHGFTQRAPHQAQHTNEARGIIMDLLQNRELAPNIVTCLKAVAQLLNQPQTGMHGFNFNELGLPRAVENPFGGEQLLVATASKPRVSNITFSTVTSATGLPTIAAEPQNRSSKYWKSNEPNSSSNATCTCSSKTASACVLHHSTNEANKAARRRFSSPTAEKLSSTAQGQRHVSEPDATNIGTINSYSTSTLKDPSLLNDRRYSNNPSPIPIPSPASGGFSPSTSSFLSSTPTFAKSPSLIAKSPSPSVAFIQEESEDFSEEDQHDVLPTTTKQLPENQAEKRDVTSASSIGSPTNECQTIQTKDGSMFDCTEIERDPTLRRISEWSFPIFHLAERHKRTILSRLTYSIFKQADLFSIFKISPVKFFNFFHALETSYHEIDYHNRIHASDVLHACHYLICHPVRAFLGRPPTPDEEDIDDGMEPLSFGPILDSAPLPIAGSMSALELMALYTAAAAHDVDHPGRTNAFLVAAEDRKAILYNDRSVLENHHAAESWRILSQTQNNFIETLDSAETKRFRYLVLEYILATDLKQHFDIIMSFNDKAAEMDLASESDRVLISQMIIKFADINSPAKPFTLHRQWTDRICREFYEQGDDEKRRNMPISPYMDRNEPAVAKLQDSFIAHIVNPLVMALNEAGLLPVLPGLEESEILINLKHNHQKWLIEIDEQQQLLDANAATDEESKQQSELAENSDTASSATTTTVEIEQQLKQRELAETQISRQPNGTMNKICIEEDTLGRFE